MRAIIKGAEPPSLTEHRQTAHCNYDNYDHKDALRLALVTEQRGLCCYCMSRIHNDMNRMKIEHWHCRENHSAEQLSYRNLLGACLGGMGQPGNLQHCDSRKGMQDLIWNPADPSHHIETRIRYEPDGSIHSDEVILDSQLNKVLNLNLPQLKNNRREVLTGILEWWKLEQGRLQGPVPRDRFERARDQRIAGAGELVPYCQVSIWWLQKRLERMAR